MTALEQIHGKVVRAEKHISDLNSELLAFKHTKPYSVGTKEDPQTRCLVYYITKADQIPAVIPLISGDALQNLRAALDHLAWQLVAPSERSSNTAFPISDDAARYETDKIRRLKGARRSVLDAVDALKPYKGGNDTLWRLHRLNNIDKHRLLITVGAAYRSVNIAPHLVGLMVKAGVAMHLGLKPEAAIQMPDIHLRPKDNLFPLQAGSELFKDMPGAEPNPKITFQADVAFGEAGICEGEPLFETLKGMLDLVRRIVSDFGPLLRS